MLFWRGTWLPQLVDPCSCEFEPHVKCVEITYKHKIEKQKQNPKSSIKFSFDHDDQFEYLGYSVFMLYDGNQFTAWTLSQNESRMT